MQTRNTYTQYSGNILGDLMAKEKTGKADPELISQFLSDSLNNHIQAKQHYDNKANWILGVSAVMMSLLLTELKTGINGHSLGFFIVFLSSLIAFLLSLVTITLPRFIKHNKRQNSIMYFKSCDHTDCEKILHEMKTLTTDKIIENYTHEISNLVRSGLLLKAKLIKLPFYILFIGTLLGCILIFLG
jgi:hypothetical protein